VHKSIAGEPDDASRSPNRLHAAFFDDAGMFARMTLQRPLASHAAAASTACPQAAAIDAGASRPLRIAALE